MDDREYIPVKGNQGLHEKNPNFTGSKFEILTSYPCKIIAPLDGVKKYMKSKNMKVIKMPSNFLYIIDENGQACFTDTVEGVHFTVNF